jgi:PAS domain S-box-containing protein
MGNRPLHILLIDDDEDDYIITRDLLSDLNEQAAETAAREFEIEWVATYEAGLAAVTQGQHDVYLIDFRLGGHDGLELLREAIIRGCSAPLILLTGQGDRIIDMEAMKAGAADYLVKGQIDAPLLERSIRYAIERKRAAEALNASETRYRVVSELTSDYAYAFWVEPDYRLTSEWVTGAFTRITGYTSGELENMGGWPALVHPDDKALLAERIELLISGQSDVREFRIITKAGQIRWLRDYARPVWHKNQERVIRIYGAAQDITDRRQLEEQFRQSQKMEAIGKLASGVAHDFNNILTVIMGNCDFLLNNLRHDDPLRKEVEQIERAGARAASLTRQLLAFSRQQVLQPREVELNTIITNLEKMLKRLIGEDIELLTILDPQLHRLKADSGQLEQVIMNLVVNARDAMPEGGKLTLETRNVYLDEAYVAQHIDVLPGPYIMLAISDTGIGMDNDTLARIFEPFFTTKELGKGTGLGLATVHGIVTQSGGHISVYSQPGCGTIFKVYLPQLLQTTEAVENHKLPAAMVKGSETILLVEDEELVREMTNRVLRKYGYTVLQASHGKEALRVCETYKDKINLLITDIIMPGGMNGHDLAERLGSLHPEMKILYMSGYADNTFARQGVLIPGIAFLQKPFTPKALIHKVRDILDVN